MLTCPPLIVNDVMLTSLKDPMLLSKSNSFIRSMSFAQLWCSLKKVTLRVQGLILWEIEVNVEVGQDTIRAQVVYSTQHFFHFLRKKSEINFVSVFCLLLI